MKNEKTIEAAKSIGGTLGAMATGYEYVQKHIKLSSLMIEKGLKFLIDNEIVILPEDEKLRIEMRDYLSNVLLNGFVRLLKDDKK